MPVAQITVDAKQDGEKSSRITVGETTYFIKKKDAWKVEPGNTYDIRYEESLFNGKTNLWIEHAMKVGSGPMKAAPPLQPQKPNGVGFRPPVTDQEKLDMRVTSWGNAFIASRSTDFERPGAFRDLAVRLTEELSSAKLRIASPQRNEEMNDDLPY